ncbi:hypothetical protein GP5015_2036 [gamma proteobacterium HTCC5015]|nr:hypothetical protein GP5015_2036 [gamma proteobacterium HTCC5015]
MIRNAEACLVGEVIVVKHSEHCSKKDAQQLSDQCKTLIESQHRLGKSVLVYHDIGDRSLEKNGYLKSFNACFELLRDVHGAQLAYITRPMSSVHLRLASTPWGLVPRVYATREACFNYLVDHGYWLSSPEQIA